MKKCIVLFAFLTGLTCEAQNYPGESYVGSTLAVSFYQNADPVAKSFLPVKFQTVLFSVPFGYQTNGSSSGFFKKNFLIEFTPMISASLESVNTLSIGKQYGPAHILIGIASKTTYILNGPVKTWQFISNFYPSATARIFIGKRVFLQFQYIDKTSFISIGARSFRWSD